MDKNSPFVITISRQLGSGGTYLGRKLAEKLGIFYADREIVRKVSEKLSVLDGYVESQEEKKRSIWEEFINSGLNYPGIYIPPKMIPPSDKDLFCEESKVIEELAKEKSAVIIGRCGFHILQNHPNHVSIFLYRDIDSRNKRIQEIYKVSEKEAAQMISQSDKERASHCKKFTGREWTDARNYDISIDTGKMDIDKIADSILYYIELNKK